MKKYLCALFLCALVLSVMQSGYAYASTAQRVGALEGDFPDGQVGVGYDSKSEVYCKYNNVTWEVVSGTLPPGLTLARRGYLQGAHARLNGTPTEVGVYKFTVMCTFEDKSTLSKEFTVTITKNPNVQDPVILGDFDNGTLDTAYSSSIAASNGSEPYVWTYSGTLPPGLTLKNLNTSRPTLSGVPTEEGTYNFSLTVTDKYNGTDTKSFTVVIGQEDDPIDPDYPYYPDDPTDEDGEYFEDANGEGFLYNDGSYIYFYYDDSVYLFIEYDGKGSYELFAEDDELDGVYTRYTLPSPLPDIDNNTGDTGDTGGTGGSGGSGESGSTGGNGGTGGGSSGGSGNGGTDGNNGGGTTQGISNEQTAGDGSAQAQSNINVNGSGGGGCNAGFGILGLMMAVIAFRKK